MVQEGRLDRIEAKLDRVVETLANLVRLEEKQVSFEQRLDRIELRQETHAKRLEKAEQEARDRAQSSARLERIAWAFITVAAAAVGVAVPGLPVG